MHVLYTQIRVITRTSFHRIGVASVISLGVEYAEQRIKDGILFIFSSLHGYSNLEYEHMHVIYRVHQAEYGIRILVAASQEYANTYSTRRVISLGVE